MSKAIHATEFYVVGGPVQPDRSCYVERPADAALMAAIRGRRLCCVLGARGIGKSSLMHRVARRLRASGELAAVVDLVQIGVLAERGSGRGWGVAIAERVARELGLDADVGPWWRAKEQDESERLAEFFWRVVLANSTAPVTVFFDGLGATAAELPFLRELLAAVQSCYARRSEEPDFRRLGFVLIGSASRRALAGNERTSSLAVADVIELDDFSAGESYALAAGFGGEPEVAQALMDRVTAWTGGHPYLTQKVARSVARKGGKLEDVERVVREQLLAPGAAESDPLLNYVHTWLVAKAPGGRRAAKLLRRLARGGVVSAPADPTVQERLLLSGVVAIDSQRRLVFRNRIFRELVGQWVKGAGLAWRLAAVAAVVVLLAAAAGYWYVRYLPTADIATLDSRTADLAAVDAAYRRLHALPGFAERAEGLFATALARESAAARTLTEAAAIDGRLRGLAGQDAAADALFAAFWLRRMVDAADAEQRDAALLLALRAADLPAAPPAASGSVAELVAADYPLLARTRELGRVPVAWRMQFGQSILAALDEQKQVQRTPFGDAAAAAAAGGAPVRLTALQQAPVTRELAVDGDGTAGAFELTLDLQHPAADEVLLTLTAPSGEQAAVAVPRGNGGGVQTFTFDAARGKPLETLADQGRRGVWRLTLVDRRAENSGTLVDWSLRFGKDSWRDEPPEPLAIPDPVRTDAVTLVTAGDWVLAQPLTTGPVGSVALWNLPAGKLVNDFFVPFTPKYLAVNAAGDRLIAATGKAVVVWNTNDGSLVARPQTNSEFVLPPIFSVDGGYFAIAERVEDGNPLYSVLRATDGSLIASFEGAADTLRWWLGPAARYLALQAPDRSIRVLGARRGELWQTLPQVREVARVVPLAEGTTLLTVDSGGEIAAWPLAAGGAARPRRLGTTSAAESLSFGGTRLAYATADAAVVVDDVATGAQVARLRGVGGVSVATQLADDGGSLVTSSGAQMRLWNLSVAGVSSAGSAAGGLVPTALALDRASGRVALGLSSGDLALDTERSSADGLRYLAHRGAVTAVALDAQRGLAVTGGVDRMVRLWDLASGMPTALGMEPASAPIALVALAADARWVASAAGANVRVASVADGAPLVERHLAGTVTALAFSPDGHALAIGDASGALTVVPLDGPGAAFTTKGMAAITALAFAPGRAQLAIGDAAGGVRLVGAADGAAMGEARHLAQPVRWLDFDSDGSVLLLATVDWLHALRSDATLAPLASRFAPRSFTAGSLAAGDGARVRRAELGADGVVATTLFDLTAAPAAAPRPGQRDWPAALGLKLDDGGRPVPFDP